MAFQILAPTAESKQGLIAFRPDLPANGTRAFSLMGGRAPKVLDGVKLDESNPDYIQITNGLTGVRVVKLYSACMGTG